MPKPDGVKVTCSECGGGLRNHRVLHAIKAAWPSERGEGHDTCQIVQCQGCESIRFRVESHDDVQSLFDGAYKPTVRVYPEYTPNARAPTIKEHSALPAGVERIYRETLTALNAGALILAGAGLRAIVEAICNHAKAPGRGLQQKIDGLVELNLLAKPQAELLHEERYIGNAAVHEVEPPARKHIDDGLAIVEALLNAIYIAPVSAKRLREGRLQKGARTSANTPSPEPEKS